MHLFERRYGGGKANATKGLGVPPNSLQSFQRNREMRSPLVLSKGMQFIDNNKLTSPQGLAVSFLRQNDSEAFRCRDQNVRRLPSLLLPFCGRCITGPKPDRNHFIQPQPGQRLLEILLNVISQSPQWRHVDTSNPVFRQVAFIMLPRKPIDNPEETGQRFS